MGYILVCYIFQLGCEWVRLSLVFSYGQGYMQISRASPGGSFVLLNLAYHAVLTFVGSVVALFVVKCSVVKVYQLPLLFMLGGLEVVALKFLEF